jgi:hypothetical protein
MFPSVEIKPLLDPNETEFSGDYGFIPPTLDLSNGDFSHSYTDLLSLTNTQETKHFNQPKNTRNALGTINVSFVLLLVNLHLFYMYIIGSICTMSTKYYRCHLVSSSWMGDWTGRC